MEVRDAPILNQVSVFICGGKPMKVFNFIRVRNWQMEGRVDQIPTHAGRAGTMQYTSIAHFPCTSGICEAR